MKLYKIDKYCITYINITYRINIRTRYRNYLSLEKHVQLQINLPLVEKNYSFINEKKKRFKKNILNLHE